MNVPRGTPPGLIEALSKAREEAEGRIVEARTADQAIYACAAFTAVRNIEDHLEAEAEGEQERLAEVREKARAARQAQVEAEGN